MKPKISVVICAFNSEATIKNTIKSITKQNFHNYEIIIVDDHSQDNTWRIIKEESPPHNLKLFRNNENRGAAFSRNIGIKESKADIIAFMDADCEADKNWLRTLYEEFNNKEVNVVMGRVRIPNSNYIGNAISSLGFPGGANLGFEKMWKVNKNGFTEHITSCNFAIRKEIFNEIGIFDENFSNAGGEDAEFSYRLKKKGTLTKYCKKALIFHVPRTSLRMFVKWQIQRGRSNYYFKKRIGNVKEFVRLRLWSSKNIIRYGLTKPPYFPIIIFLLALSFFLQTIGYFLGKNEDRSG